MNVLVIWAGVADPLRPLPGVLDGATLAHHVQQNAVPARERLALAKANGVYRIQGERTVLGWLRVPTMQADLGIGRPRV